VVVHYTNNKEKKKEIDKYQKKKKKKPIKEKGNNEMKKGWRCVGGVVRGYVCAYIQWVWGWGWGWGCEGEEEGKGVMSLRHFHVCSECSCRWDVRGKGTAQVFCAVSVREKDVWKKGRRHLIGASA